MPFNKFYKMEGILLSEISLTLQPLLFINCIIVLYQEDSSAVNWTTKPNDLSLIPRSHNIEGEKQLLQAVL